MYPWRLHTRPSSVDSISSGPLCGLYLEYHRRPFGGVIALSDSWCTLQLSSPLSIREFLLFSQQLLCHSNGFLFRHGTINCPLIISTNCVGFPCRDLLTIECTHHCEGWKAPKVGVHKKCPRNHSLGRLTGFGFGCHMTPTGPRFDQIGANGSQMKVKDGQCTATRQPPCRR